VGQVGMGISPGLVGSPHPSHGTKCKANVGPKSDHVERSDLAKRFFIVVWERERAGGGGAEA
jgi:hypothetical protein